VLDSFDFNQRPTAPLILKTRPCPALPTRTQFASYLPAVLAQATSHALGLSMSEVQRQHTTRTLAQIAAERHVAPATLAAALTAVVGDYASGAEVLGYLTATQGDALQKQQAATIEAMLQTRPNVPLAPLLAGDADIARLPHGTPSVTEQP
jgi:hypothetical protein